ncbi:ComF family protein [Halioxenophilus sp. WMMB6]|uniref:ComF family protein n=1 Tax=Halioxenophilus sp. WMMB6 TaxID=3073815 RepID=UPI00295F30FD|nr:ComF family protein [Halioxenophilus sp. WMMB6]
MITARLRAAPIRPHCLLCRAPLAAGSRRLLCGGCSEALPKLGPHCQRCGLPLAQSAPSCGDCQATPPHFQHCYTPYRYGFPLDYLVTLCKHHRHRGAERLLGQLLADYGEKLPWPEWDALVPVPLHWRKLWRRGFNQAQSLAQALHPPQPLPILRARRTRATPAQQQLNRRQRLANLRGSFVIDQPVTGLRLLLVDDVVTTGATANSLAQTLLKAGASRVDLLALARTPTPSD